MNSTSLRSRLRARLRGEAAEATVSGDLRAAGPGGLGHSPFSALVPAGTLPDGTLPDGALPGRTVPGSTLHAGTLPGSTLHADTLPDGTLPDGLDPIGQLAWAARQGAPPADAALAAALRHPPVDPVVRLVQLAALWWSAAPSAPVEAALTAAAAAQIAALRRSAAPDAALARVIAAFAWPLLPGAREDRSLLLDRLAAHLPADGGPARHPADLARTLALGQLAEAAAAANHAHLPDEALGALAAAAAALSQLRGPLPALPGPAALPLLPSPDLPGAIDLAGKDWRLWAWRESGAAVAWRAIKSAPHRLFASASGLFAWDCPLGSLLSSTRPTGPLALARVDGPRALLRFVRPGRPWSAPASREVLARQARVIITDLGATTLDWRLLPLDWQPEAEGYTAKTTGLHLTLKLDPRWRWTLTAGGHLRGEGTGEVKTSLEAR